MNAIDEMTGIISGIIGIVVLIVFFIQTSNIGAIKRILEREEKERIAQYPRYRCKHCGYRTKEDQKYCEKCDKNSAGEAKG